MADGVPGNNPGRALFIAGGTGGYDTGAGAGVGGSVELHGGTAGSAFSGGAAGVAGELTLAGGDGGNGTGSVAATITAQTATTFTINVPVGLGETFAYEIVAK